MKKKLAILLLMAVGIASLIYSHDIKQKNPETLFLTEKILSEYKEFQKNILEKHSLVIKKKTFDKELFYKELEKFNSLCIDSCEIITARTLNKNQTNKEHKSSQLLNLEAEGFVAALIIDDKDERQKRILTQAEELSYWRIGTYYAGLPYTNYLLDKYSLAIQEKLFPALFIFGFIVAYLLIGKIKNAMAVYLPCLFSAGISLASLKLLFGTMNMVTSIIPLIVFAVTLSLSFHIYFSLIELKSLKAVLKFKWAPLFLMMFTTYIGFLSLGWAEIMAIREFGFASSHLVLIATIYTFLWYYLWEKELILENGNGKRNVFPSYLFANTLKYPFIISIGIISILCVFLIPQRLEIITDATRYFPVETKIREKIVAVTKSVSGMPIMEIAMNLEHELTMSDLNKLSQVEKAMAQLNLSQKYKIVSNNTLIEEANFQYSNFREIPQNLPAYFVLRGQLPTGIQDGYPISNFYRITLLGSPLNIIEYEKDLKQVELFLKKSGIKFNINGIHHNLMLSQNAMIDALASSFISSCLIIFIFSAFFLKSIRMNLIFIFVSLVPVSLIFIFIKLFDFSINIATVMTFSISLGLLGDSSFHIIYAKTVPFKSFNQYARAVLVPVLGTGMLLSACFAILTFNSFTPIRQFGGILSIVMVLGTIVDLFVLPTLLYRSYEHLKSYDKK